MLKRVVPVDKPAKRAVFTIRLTGDEATLCAFLNFNQLAKLRKTLKAIVTHEILNFDSKPKEEESKDE